MPKPEKISATKPKPDLVLFQSLNTSVTLKAGKYYRCNEYRYGAIYMDIL